jgi:[glutamine synthetase] adenylyltransferase / [glutamine synthetase]-adenylyl-L-tyrosine phosphorylase
MSSQLHAPALPVSTPKQIEELVDSSPDPDRVLHHVAEFSSRYPERWNEIVEDAERSRWLLTIFGFSHFLSEELLRNPEWISSIDAFQKPLGLSEYKERLDAFLKQTGVAAPTAGELALFRRRELLRIAVRDALKAGALAEIVEELSDLADAILDCALRSTISELEGRYGYAGSEESSGETARARFTVLALGKLGGRELNYSSDLDLMFVYSDNGETTGPHKISNKEFFKKVANQFTNLLSTYTAAGVCYRVDLRLRPEGTLGDVCISLAAAKEYYAKRARDWELQMLIKARVAAGDQALGQALLDSVEPAIYSTTLDFSTIEAMSTTRERIGEKLARKRLRKDELDVKLARGGIRDLEFLVQCLQRLHGGRETWVRHGGTLLALSRLHDKNLLAATEYSRLCAAYEFLRQLEHRLQVEDDRQTHTLPSNPADLERTARRMPSALLSQQSGVSASAQLLQTLNQHLENVQGIYEGIVHSQRPLYYTPASAGSSTTDAPHKHREESRNVRVSDEVLQSLKQVAPQLAERLVLRGMRGPGRGLESFLEKALQDSWCIPLLDRDPMVAEWTAQIFELSPYLAEHLMRRPELLKDIHRIAEDPERRPALEQSAPPLNDVDGLRRFFARQMFCVQASSICLREPVFTTLDRTSAVAEFVIARAYRMARAQGVAHARAHSTPEKPFQEPQSEMMVVALGRLGMREFDLGSDADLLFIIPDNETVKQRFWTRVAEHLIEILTAYGGEGPILSIDTRLRPNGRAGMLVQTESKYVEYFSNKAEAWEGIAYMKARGVAGDTERATKFLNELQQVDWRRYGQSGRSKQDLRHMRMRLQREQGTVTPLKAAEGGYYDADFILMYLRLKGAGMFFKSLNTPERIDIVEKMGHLERADAEFLLRATTFFRAIDHALRVVTGRAEEKLPESGAEREMIGELVCRWTGEHPSASTLEHELDALRGKMRRVFDSIFGH